MESQVPHLSLKYIDILSLTNNSSVMNKSNNSTIPDWSDPVVRTSLVFIVIGLIFGLIIILVKRLHTQSTGNNVFVAVTMIILSTGLILLSAYIVKKLAVISEELSAGLTTIAMIIGSRIRGFSRQSKITIIVFLCIFILLGIVFTTVGFLHEILYILAGICWSVAMFIVIILTSYYVMIRFPGYFSSLYVTFVIFYEFVITTLIILSCSICYPEIKNQTNTTMFKH
uniref:SJCHGC06448 protein n=1 Tax=Schistosoma japonicum TaxID=6182 RepID=Q5DGM8_SCHJA|nr:SJCHGC06448 protein [Schistosoma japonicum]